MKEEPSFFVGYLPAPADTWRFAGALVAAIFAGATLLAFVLGRTPTEVGASSYGDELSITGLIVARPYPLVVAPPDAAHPQGRAIMLGGDGKHGASDFTATLDGRSATVRGVVVKRGDLDMLLTGPADVSAASLTTRAPPVVALGRWRVHGEICDGKCAAGGMAPGAGLAHKACANLCIAGGLPPVLVSASPIEGRHFLLLASADGGPAPTMTDDLVALPIALEGDVERRGDLLIFRVDWTKASRR